MTIHNDLTQSKEEMIEALHRGRWSNIKRALKKDIVIKQLTTEDEINQAHLLITDTYLRINLPAPHPQLFLNTVKELKQHCYLVGAFAKDKLIGCRVYLICNKQMYDWYAAIDRNYSNYQVADLLPWHMMLWGKENGIKLYDFAGAGKPNQEYSVREYKLKFGGKLLSFGRYMLVHKPLMYNIGKAGLQLYKYIR
jgi:lipid II:glycine glycyltransferase (peptidoglycan interpeptide bridge formation enzyme)